MRILLPAAAAALLAAGCTTGGGLTGRDAPDEFAVTRGQPLVVPHDFALTPPKAGEPVPAGVDSRAAAVSALFGGPAARSAAEQQLIQQSGAAATTPGARSTAADPNTTVVDKGATTQTILAVPEGDGQEARVQTPQ